MLLGSFRYNAPFCTVGFTLKEQYRMDGTADRTIGLVGCGHRGIVGFLASFKDLGLDHHVVALCDANPTRLDFAHGFLGQGGCAKYVDYAEFLQHPGLDAVIVATPDYTHREFVVRAFEAGKDVVCEKPMATTLEDCRAMLEARGEHRLRVAFNFRYNSLARRVKDLLTGGTVGPILHVEARDTVGWEHGSDYFRRWHRLQAKSGGLLVHKSTHTFDVINWWLDDQPATVSAAARRRFYTPDRQRGERCQACEAADQCRFHVDLTEDVPGQFAGVPHFYERIYLEAEAHDGYRRDVCVFHRDNNVPDTYLVRVAYGAGALLNYSALFYAPYEDRTFVLQGATGRMEVSKVNREIILYPDNRAGNREVITVPEEPGGHGGADLNLVRSLVADKPIDEQCATAEDGYWSLAVGACANRSIRQDGVPVEVPAP